MKPSNELSKERSSGSQAAAAPSEEPVNYFERCEALEKENQELYEKLARSQSLVTELEATIEGLRDQLEEAKCR